MQSKLYWRLLHHIRWYQITVNVCIIPLFLNMFANIIGAKKTRDNMWRLSVQLSRHELRYQPISSKQIRFWLIYVALAPQVSSSAFLESALCDLTMVAESDTTHRLQLKRGLFSYLFTYFLQMYSKNAWILIEIN